MEKYIRTEHQCLEEDGKLNNLISDIKSRNQQPKPLRQSKIDEAYYPPTIPTVDDDCTWQDRLSSIGI